MTWRVAKALETLRSEVNTKWPTRAKQSDGTIGNEEHAGRGAGSDHNPHVMDGMVGVVTGMDITHDPRSGCDSYALAEALRASRDPRIKYVISNRRICNPDVQNWAWRPYHGKNPHDHHVHVSVKASKTLYDNVGEWAALGIAQTRPQPSAPAALPVLRKGDSGEQVRFLQHAINASRATNNIVPLGEDGDYGDRTVAAVRRVQQNSRTHVDGVAGPQTWVALGVKEVPSDGGTVAKAEENKQ